MIETVLFDADGVLWVGDKLVSGAPETIDALRANGINVFIVTNNSNNTRTEIVAKMHRKGYHNINEEMIVSAGYVTAQYLLTLGFGNQDRKVFVVGESGLAKELKQNGINIMTIDDFPDNVEIADLKIPGDIMAVVAAYDGNLTYRKLAVGTRILIENDAMLIGTNCDAADPYGNGVFLPDSMPIIVFLEAAAQKSPIVLGKPTKYMFEPLERTKGINPKTTLMVGDRLNTDIKFAKTIGSRGAIVLTGITTLTEAQGIHEELKPDFIVNSSANIAELVSQINTTIQM